jgi:hypothetical protein
MPPANPADSAVSLPRRAWIVLAVVFALGFVHFWVRTTPVRLANPDDIAFQGLVDQNQVADFTSRCALDQGRFYFESPVFGCLFSAHYKIHQPWLYSLIRAVALFTQIGLAGWLLARVTRRPAWGATLALFILGTLHFPLTFYPVLSYPNFWIGFTAVLISLHLHLTYIHRPGLVAGILTGAFLLLAGLMHEFFVVFLPCFLALAWLRPVPGRSGRLRANLAPLVTAAGYAVVFVLFAREFPTTYAGTQFSPDPVAAGQVVVRQMAGIIPGFELLVQRLPPGTRGPLSRSWPDVLQTVAGIPWPDLLLGLVEAATLTGLLLHSARHPPPLLHRWPWALGFAAYLNLPIAFSRKYQIFILHREFPYAYAFYSSIFLSFALIATGDWCLQRLSGPLDHRLLHGLLGLLTAALCLSAMASNYRILQILLQRYN